MSNKDKSLIEDDEVGDIWENIYHEEVCNILDENYELLRSTGKWVEEALDSASLADEVMILIYLRTLLSDQAPTIRELYTRHFSSTDFHEALYYSEQDRKKLLKLFINKGEVWETLWPSISEIQNNDDSLPNLHDADWLLWNTFSVPVFIELLAYGKVGRLSGWKTGVSKTKGLDYYLDGIFEKARNFVSLIPTTWISKNSISKLNKILVTAQTRRSLDNGRPILAENFALLAEVHPKTIQNAISKNDLVLAIPDNPESTGSRKKPKYISPESGLSWLTSPRRGKNTFFETNITGVTNNSIVSDDQVSEDPMMKIPMDETGTVFLPYMRNSDGYHVNEKIYPSYSSALQALQKSKSPRWRAIHTGDAEEDFLVSSWVKMRKKDIDSLVAALPFTQN